MMVMVNSNNKNRTNYAQKSECLYAFNALPSIQYLCMYRAHIEIDIDLNNVPHVNRYTLYAYTNEFRCVYKVQMY